MISDADTNKSDATPTRLRIVIQGAVQGVGFRPFVFRLAKELGLRGWVNNSAQGVFLEVEGTRGRLEGFSPRSTGKAAAQFYPKPRALLAGPGGLPWISRSARA